jgi:hypothetical protein
MKINLEKWNAQRLAVETRIRSLKDSIRHGGTREDSVWNSETRKYELKPVTFSSGMGTYRDYALLDQLKNEATLLYKVRAQARGRHHQLTMTKEEEAEQVKFLLEDWAIPEPQVATA